MDERVDVFALGSILCEILTGKPAFTGRTVSEIQSKAARCDLEETRARLEACEVDEELVLLARECLAEEPADRPRDAGDLVERVSRYLNGVQERLRASEVACAAEAARAEEARHTAEAERRSRRLTVALAASILGLVGLGLGGYGWSQHQRAERHAKLARAVDDALAEAGFLQAEALAAPPGELGKWGEALAAAKRAESLLNQEAFGDEDRRRVAVLRGRIEHERQVARDRARVRKADQALLAELETVRGSQEDGNDGFRRTDGEYQTAFLKAGLNVKAMGPAEAAGWIRARSKPADLAAYLDDWASVKRRAAGAGIDAWRSIVAAASAADPNPWRNALRRHLGSTEEEARAELRRLADDMAEQDGQPPESLVLLARELRNLGEPSDRQRAVEILRRAATRHPDDFWVQVELSRMPGVSTEEALRHLTAATAIRPESASAHRKLAEHLNQRVEAVAEYREVLRLQPDSSWAQLGLCKALQTLGKLGEEIEAYRAAIRRRPDDAWAHARLGVALKVQRQYEEAIEEFHRATKLNPDMALAHVELGGLLWDQGRKADAAVPWSEAVRLNPDDAIMQINLGSARLAAGDYRGAVESYREAVRLQPDNASVYTYLGTALTHEGDLAGAEVAYHQAIRLNPGMASAHLALGHLLWIQGRIAEAAVPWSEAVRLNPDDALTQMNLGSARRFGGDFDGAVASYREGVRLKPHVDEFRRMLGHSLREVNQMEAAIAEFREAARLRPDDFNHQVSLGLALRDDGKLAEAIDAFRQAVSLNPDGPFVHRFLGHALALSGDMLGATDEFLTAIRLNRDPSYRLRTLQLSGLSSGAARPVG